MALTYFLNADLNTEQTTLALSNITKIDRARSRERESSKLLTGDLPSYQLDPIWDILEMFYFNHYRIGLSFDSSEEVRIFDLDEVSDDITDPYTDAYAHNRKKWRQYCLQLIKDLQGIHGIHRVQPRIPLRKPRDSQEMPAYLWLYLAEDISQKLRKRHGYQITREMNSQWSLRQIDDAIKD